MMREAIHFLGRIESEGLMGFGQHGRYARSPLIDGLSGYILDSLRERPSSPRVRAWGYVVIVTQDTGVTGPDDALPQQPIQIEGSLAGQQPAAPPKPRVLTADTGRTAAVRMPPHAQRKMPVRALRPIRSGRFYRIASKPARGLVRPELAQAMEKLFEAFARERSFSEENPLAIHLLRGFKARSHGHGEGRAVDIAAVGRKGLLAWKQEWDQAHAAAAEIVDKVQQAAEITAEKKHNLGYGLYKALQAHGGWRLNNSGWQPYRGVVQLFGPWTASEGPHKALQIEHPSPYQQRRLRDQRWIFGAHQDHIHVAL